MLLLVSRSVRSDSVTPWTAALQAPLLSFTVAQSLLKLRPVESVGVKQGPDGCGASCGHSGGQRGESVLPASLPDAVSSISTLPVTVTLFPCGSGGGDAVAPASVFPSL